MNTVQDAIAHIERKKVTYWRLKTSSGKLKGDFESDDLQESIQEFSELANHLTTGKYELLIRSSKQNYRGETVFDFEVYHTGFQAQKTNNTTAMDAAMFQVMVDIKTSLTEIKMLIQQHKEHTDSRFKELGKALSEIFDEDEKPAMSPMEMVKGLQGLKNAASDLKL
ncbi:hypothetical protein [Runella limosa]|uniref:hypothetical protein n=1 Tax=Runella limosa TaxID=370978 RepID=UPI00040198C8|nr:hypothetical protein [Runella limosa]